MPEYGKKKKKKKKKERKKGTTISRSSLINDPFSALNLSLRSSPPNEWPNAIYSRNTRWMSMRGTARLGSARCVRARMQICKFVAKHKRGPACRSSA